MKMLTNIVRVVFIVAGLYLFFGSFLEKGNEKGNILVLGIVLVILGVFVKGRKKVPEVRPQDKKSF
jgi:membrane-bound ClpP family serine protease